MSWLIWQTWAKLINFLSIIYTHTSLTVSSVIMPNWVGVSWKKFSTSNTAINKILLKVLTLTSFHFTDQIKNAAKQLKHYLKVGCLINHVTEFTPFECIK